MKLNWIEWISLLSVEWSRFLLTQTFPLKTVTKKKKNSWASHNNSSMWTVNKWMTHFIRDQKDENIYFFHIIIILLYSMCNSIKREYYYSITMAEQRIPAFSNKKITKGRAKMETLRSFQQNNRQILFANCM